ncbi:autotransporter domain-containing protein [Pseudoxanthomonas wuyuanensis]|nr:autotransporter domain-containing protein [Pseudoxanthomonas wuyuanensis]
MVRAARLTAGGLALLLAACGGGGGGNVRNDPPPVSPPPATPPPPAPAGASLHLQLTNTTVAHAAGFTGQGVRIGVVDSGVNRNHPALAGRVIRNFTYINPNTNNLAVDDVVGHGTWVSQILAGAPFANSPGGIAPGAQIVSARIISDRAPSDDGSGQGNQVDGALGLLPVHQDLIAAGARIMNNSWGGLYWTNPAATAPIADEYRPFVFANDGLVVFATGNSGFANPSDMAALPSQPGVGGSMPAADLERGWLAVAALDSNNPHQLAGYSNACGIAMRYCLVAPGSVIVTNENATEANHSYGTVSGTSLAAPQVSGAAALVWEAFPYFNNDLVRQTLLGTATDLGDPGVDAVFGYGLLNVGKAVLGPSRFDWGDVTVSFDGITSVWSNAISGDGGLIKRGSGRLELAFSTNYGGDTRVQGGTLAFSSSVPGDSFIEAGGNLELRGLGVHGDVDNRGTLTVQGMAGSRLVEGNYVQGSGGRFAYQVGSPLNVFGTAQLAGDLQVIGIRSGYVRSDRELVLTAQGGLSGRFDSLSNGPGVFLQATLGYDATEAWLDITRLDIAATAMAFGQISAASAAAAVRMEQAFKRMDAHDGDAAGAEPVADTFRALAGEFQRSSTQAEAKASLASLSGELHAAADAMTFDAIDVSRRALSARFDQLIDLPRPRGDWYRRLGEAGQGSYGGNDFRMDGWMLGSDLRLGEYGVAGVAFGEIRAHSQIGGGRRDRSQDRQAQGQVYLGSVRGQAYALGQLGFGRYDRQMRRELWLGQAHRGVNSEYAGDFTSASIETGYRFGTALAAMTPYLGVDHARVDRDGFSEAGASGFGLRTDASQGQRTQAIAGVRLARSWDGRHGRGFGARGYAEWQQTLAARGLGIDASFVGAEAWAPLVGISPEASGGVFGFSFESHLADAATLSFGYDQSFGPRERSRMLSARFAVGF